MTYITTLRAHMVKRTRRDHRCYDCGHVIPAGSRCWSETFVNDGVHTLWCHPDCQKAALHYCTGMDWPDLADGVPPLHEMIWGGDGQHELDRLRGHFPHVVTRIEFWEQR